MSGQTRLWRPDKAVLYHAFEGRPEPRLPLVALRRAVIYHQHPSTPGNDAEAPIFPNLSFALDSDKASTERWAVISKESGLIRTKFLQALQGHYSCLPPSARAWPYLASEEYRSQHGGSFREPSRALRYVGFANQGAGTGSTGTQGAYLGARYESRKETTDWSLLDYLRGTVNLNLSEEEVREAENLQNDPFFSRVLKDFKLESLVALPVGNLSNGQTRRARIAKSLLSKPELLLLDEPFAGLDPVNSRVLSELLSQLAQKSEPRILLALPPTEVPEWITHCIHLAPTGEILATGEKVEVFKADQALTYLPGAYTPQKFRNYTFADSDKQAMKEKLRRATRGRVIKHEPGRLHKSMDEDEMKEIVRAKEPDFPFWDQLDPSDTAVVEPAQPLVEMEGVKVCYGDKCVLGDWKQEIGGRQQDGMFWKVSQGQRWGIFGPNGSGKTTVISLLTSDHPQAYKLPLKLFGRSRLPSPGQPGISVFDLQSRIGHSSPEVHTYFPKHFTLRQTIESAWADAFHSKPRLTFESDEAVSAALKWFQKELDPACANQPDLLEQIFRLPYTYDNILATQQDRKRHTVSQGPVHQFRNLVNGDPTWSDEIKFAELSLSAQRVALFLRAIIKKPDIVVLDEAFSGMDEWTRKKCMLFLAHGDQKYLRAPYSRLPLVRPKIDTPIKALKLSKVSGLEPRQALICVSHRKEEVPFLVDRWLRLPEANEGNPAVFGTIDRSRDWWSDIWDNQ